MPAQNPFRSMIATLTASRRNMAIAGGALGVVLLVLVIAFAGGKSKPKAVASREKPNKAETAAVERKPEPAAETPAAKPEEPAEAKATEDPAAATAPEQTPATGSDTGEPATATAPAGATTKTPATPKAPVAPGAGAPKKTLGGKQLVLEYDAQAKEAAKPVAAAPKNDQAAILKARASYAQGNQRLLAGDWNGAILKYRQSLANYPGYVAGYRGLGLAFMQMGDKPKALQALRLYISSVPNAKDAPLIKQRIAQLQK